MRSRSGTRNTLARRLATIMAAVGALLISSGIALMATPTPASAGDNSGNGTDKPWICHAVEGKGETKTGYNIIAPAQASIHIDEALYPAGTYWKHASKDGTRHDEYATFTDGEWTCPGPEVLDLEASASVQWIDPTCDTKAGYDVSSGDPVDVTWSPASASPAPGVTLSLTATAMDGYSFAGLPTKVFTHTFAQVVPPQGQTYNPESGVCAAVTPPVVSPPVVSPPTMPTQVSPPKAKTHTTVKAETTTPTVVEAGLAGEPASSSGTGLGLTAAGLLLLAGAGGLVLLQRGRRTIAA